MRPAFDVNYQASLVFAVRELLGSLPERRDWFNPDAERVFREYLSDAKAHGQGTGSPPGRDEARYQWLRDERNQDHEIWERLGKYQINGAEFDAEIDAAMAASSPTKEGGQ